MSYFDELIGLHMWGSNHMGQSRGFQFGGPHIVEKRGEFVSLGDIALHIQGRWLISLDGKTEIADFSMPPERASVALETFLRENIATVHAVTLGRGDHLYIELSGGITLEVDSYTDDTVGDELWRLFAPCLEREHLVKLVAAPPAAELC